METMQAQGTDVEAAGEDVFSLTTILDPSAALAAARRLYAQNRAGLRFFCENRRVVPVNEAEELAQAFEEGGSAGYAAG
ncbi:MAG TPA: hypothetical protein PKD87_14195 [Burkholderiaceae bacterium]|jgi:hypothetical protein|nr:MAG: hypothetical protein ABS56_03405 [Lautropia sp. SCN 69-89]HMM52749.1 hypothetical protein [Burkholderiaceae bacterium]